MSEKGILLKQIFAQNLFNKITKCILTTWKHFISSINPDIIRAGKILKPLSHAVIRNILMHYRIEDKK